MKPHALVITLCLLVPALYSYAQPDHIKIAKKSGWVDPVTYNAQARPDEGQGASHYYILLDEQENTATKEDYYHYAYVILTNEAVQEMSDLSFDFDPAYQELIFHEIRIIRGNTTLNQLSKDISVIQREQSMDRHLYDGTKTAVVNLRDIRVGDIVEYAFTRKGYNPVYKGHIARTYSFDFYNSIDKYYKKLIVPVSLELQVKSFGQDVVQPQIKKAGNLVHYTWDIGKTDPTLYDDNIPAWYDYGRWVSMSDFASWAAVGDWAKELFTISNADKEKIAKNIAPQFKSADAADYALEVIRFVQDEVRYLGFETGINSHKPYPPTQVYEQRFGDCKDKSLLLTSLLQARGIEAYPMLVNTTAKHSLQNRIPSATAFDHCVVQIIFNNEKIYIDPTISNQGGDLFHRYFPGYGRGLVIDNDITALDSLPEPQTATTTETQNFEVLTIGGEATLTVRTSYTGSGADNQRSEFLRTSLETIQKNYKQYYANLYPDITVWEDLSFKDDRNSNVFIVEEKYKIPTFWKPIDGQDNKIYCSLQPQSIAPYFDVSKNIQQRTAPYLLPYPVDFYHHIHIKLPEEWPISPVDEVIENEFYQYEYTVKRNRNELSRMTHYTTKQDHIPADKIAIYVKDHTKMYDNLAYDLTYDKNIAAASANTLPGVITSIISLIAAAVFAVALYKKYDPKPARHMVQGSPIGGWLVLVGIGTVVTPLRILFDLVTNPELINGAGWMALYSAKQYGAFAFTLFTHVYNYFFLFFSAMLALLFFQRRTSYPRLMSIQLGLSFVIGSADVLVARALSDDPAGIEIKDAVRAFIAAAIWIPYLNISQRVKETFVVRNAEDDNDAVEDRKEEAVNADVQHE